MVAFYQRGLEKIRAVLGRSDNVAGRKAGAFAQRLGFADNDRRPSARFSSARVHSRFAQSVTGLRPGDGGDRPNSCPRSAESTRSDRDPYYHFDMRDFGLAGL